MISRRTLFRGSLPPLLMFFFPHMVQGNPFVLFLRFLFGMAVRSGARSGLRLLGRGMIGRSGRSRLIARNGREVTRTTSQAAMIATAPEQERKWTKEFIETGLEEMIFQTLDIPSLGTDEDIEIPDGAPVYEIENQQSARLAIEVENRSSKLQIAEITLYLYDIDAGLVDTKYPYIFASIEANTLQRFDIDLRPLKYQGRKTICVKQTGFEGRISPLIYVV